MRQMQALSVIISYFKHLADNKDVITPALWRSSFRREGNDISVCIQTLKYGDQSFSICVKFKCPNNIHVGDEILKYMLAPDLNNNGEYNTN